jgi:hypothetical protein
LPDKEIKAVTPVEIKQCRESKQESGSSMHFEDEISKLQEDRLAQNMGKVVDDALS